MAEMGLERAIEVMQDEVIYTLGHLELPRLAAGVAGFDGSEEADKKFMEIQDEVNDFIWKVYSSVGYLVDYLCYDNSTPNKEVLGEVDVLKSWINFEPPNVEEFGIDDYAYMAGIGVYPLDKDEYNYPDQLLALQAIHRVIYEIESRADKKDKRKEKPSIEDILQTLDELIEIKIDKKISAETVPVELTEKEKEFREKYIEETKKRISSLRVMIDFIMGEETISYKHEELGAEVIIADAREVLVEWVNEEYSVEFFIVRGEDTLKHNDEYMQAVEFMIKETSKTIS